MSRELWALSLPAGRSRKELREKGPPRVLEPLEDVVLMEGSAAKLTCRISAFPDPFIRWSKDGKELRDGPKYRYIFEDPDVVALVVRDGELADLGQYSINVTNPLGQCPNSARILVEGTRPVHRHGAEQRHPAGVRSRPRPRSYPRAQPSPDADGSGPASGTAGGTEPGAAPHRLRSAFLPRDPIPPRLRSRVWVSIDFRAPRSQRSSGRARVREKPGLLAPNPGQFPLLRAVSKAPRGVWTFLGFHYSISFHAPFNPKE